jgi:hypothetical protein
MPQQPDKNGKIQVSNKMDAVEHGRSLANCKKLPGKVKMIEYNETAHKRYNDYLENETPEITTNTWKKMKLVCDDLERALTELDGLKAEMERKDTIIERLIEEKR